MIGDSTLTFRVETGTTDSRYIFVWMYRRVGGSEPHYYTYKILVNTHLQVTKEGTVVKYFLESYESARLSFKPLVNRRETQVSKEKQPNY